MLINELIDELVEECSDDVRNALRALLLINERLGARLDHLHEQSRLPTLERRVLH